MASKKRVLIAKETRKEYGYLDPTVAPQPDVHVKRSERQVEQREPGISGMLGLKPRKQRKEAPTKTGEDFLRARSNEKE